MENKHEIGIYSISEHENKNIYVHEKTEMRFHDGKFQTKMSFIQNISIAKWSQNTFREKQQINNDFANNEISKWIAFFHETLTHRKSEMTISLIKVQTNQNIFMLIFFFHKRLKLKVKDWFKIDSKIKLS